MKVYFVTFKGIWKYNVRKYQMEDIVIAESEKDAIDLVEKTNSAYMCYDFVIRSVELVKRVHVTHKYREMI